MWPRSRLMARITRGPARGLWASRARMPGGRAGLLNGPARLIGRPCQPGGTISCRPASGHDTGKLSCGRVELHHRFAHVLQAGACTSARLRKRPVDFALRGARHWRVGRRSTTPKKKTRSDRQGPAKVRGRTGTRFGARTGWYFDERAKRSASFPAWVDGVPSRRDKAATTRKRSGRRLRYWSAAGSRSGSVPAMAGWASHRSGP